VLLSIIIAAFTTLLVTRKDGEFLVIRQNKAEPFITLPDGRIANQFKVHIGNKSEEPRKYTISLVREDPVTLLTPLSPYPLEPGHTAMMPLFIQFNLETFTGNSVLIELRDEKDVIGRQEVPLLKPGSSPKAH
jgi:hypothetical protein